MDVFSIKGLEGRHPYPYERVSSRLGAPMGRPYILKKGIIGKLPVITIGIGEIG